MCLLCNVFVQFSKYWHTIRIDYQIKMWTSWLQGWFGGVANILIFGVYGQYKIFWSVKSQCIRNCLGNDYPDKRFQNIIYIMLRTMTIPYERLFKQRLSVNFLTIYHQWKYVISLGVKMCSILLKCSKDVSRKVLENVFIWYYFRVWGLVVTQFILNTTRPS